MSKLACRTDALEPLPVIGRYMESNLDRREFLNQGQAYLADLNLWLRENNPNSRGTQTLGAYSQAHDLLIRAAYDYCVQQWKADTGGEAPHVGVLALGGYGLNALCLKSDVDILLLMDDSDRRVETFVKTLLLVLIDFKLNLGYSTRTIADCEAKVGSDLESVTAMTSSRRIAGNKALSDRLTRTLRQSVCGRGRRWFLRGIFEEWKTRREKYESTVYLIQPNLKEGQGGLRDLDSVRWLLYGITGGCDLQQSHELAFFDERALGEYIDAASMIQTVRNELHLADTSSGDQLRFEFMPEIAVRLGYEPDALHSAEELFMADYYQYARRLDRFSASAVQKLARRERSVLGGLVGSLKRRRLDEHIIVQDEVMFVDPKSLDYFEDDPSRIMTLFERATQWGYRLSDHTLDNLARLAPALCAAFRLDPHNLRCFMRILRHNAHVGQTLADMHECRMLGRFIPEFERLRCMVRIDYYHHYTVDEHTLKTFEMAEKLRNEPVGKRSFASRIALEIKRWDLLHLALLLHDIGKGYGRGHALRGGQIAQRACERLNLSRQEIETVRFLVLSHLKLNHAGQRRDVSDPEVSHQLAQEIGSVRLLKMLYVHTVCDLMSVSPDAWNQWKAQLLEECYKRTADVLSGHQSQAGRGGSELTADRQRVYEAVLAEGRKSVDGKKAKETLATDLRSYIDEVSDRYLDMVSPEVIARHYKMRRQLNEENLLVWQLHNEPEASAGRSVSSAPSGEMNNRTGLSQLTVYAADVSGLFRYICGALASKGINIWAAQIFSTRDGYAINQFSVTDLDGRRLSEGLRLNRLQKDLNLVIKGEMDIEALITKHRTRQPRRSRPRQVHPTRIIFDNQSSTRYTIIEIRSGDQPGLLYQITSALNQCNLDIHRAIISTEAYGVVDVFYVTDMEYNKIHYPGDQDKIRESVMAAVN